VLNRHGTLSEVFAEQCEWCLHEQTPCGGLGHDQDSDLDRQRGNPGLLLWDIRYLEIVFVAVFRYSIVHFRVARARSSKFQLPTLTPSDVLLIVHLETTQRWERGGEDPKGGLLNQETKCSLCFPVIM